MAMIICPECKEQISQYAENCIKCGFPIKKFMEENNFTDITKAYICPKCANSYELEYIPLNLKCEYCDTILVQTDISMKELFQFSNNSTDEEFNYKCIEFAKKFGNNQFDETAFKNRLQKNKIEIEKFLNKIDKNNSCLQQNIPRCPHCQSTNIKKLSLTNKAISIGGLGILSNKIGKTFQCNNCKYTW